MKKIVVLFVLLALSFGIFAQGKPEATGSSQASTKSPSRDYYLLG